MANDIFNYLSVKGDNTLINRLKNSAKYDPENKTWCESEDKKWYESEDDSGCDNSLFCFTRIYPEPKLLIDTERIYYKNMEYRFKAISDAEYWRIQHWGTDGDIRDVVEQIDESELWRIRFMSRFAPPLLALQKISADNCGLTFELGYWTPDSDFQGDAIFKDGECILDERAIWLPTRV